MLDTRRLEVFLAVLTSGSFTAAAEQLHISQPAVSHSVAALERELGATLLTRRRGGVVATSAGSVLADHAHAVLSRLSLAAAHVRQLDDGAQSVVRFGAFGTALGTLLPAALELVRADRPQLAIDVVEGDTATLKPLVASGELDIALGFDDARSRADLGEVIRTDLFTEQMRVALPPWHRFQGRAPVPLEALDHDRWLSPSPDHFVMRICRDHGFEPNVVVWATDVLAVRSLVLSVDVVTLIPQLLEQALHPVTTAPLARPVYRTVFAITAEPTTARSRLLLNALVHTAPRYSAPERSS